MLDLKGEQDKELDKLKNDLAQKKPASSEDKKSTEKESLENESASSKEEDSKKEKTFGRDEEDFSLLYLRDYGQEKEAHYAKEIAGAGCVLRVISEYDGVKTESSVFVPGASIIDLYENPDDKSELTGRTLAKR